MKILAAITGAGAVSSLGRDPAAFAAALLAGERRPGPAGEIALESFVPAAKGYHDRTTVLALAAAAGALGRAGIAPAAVPGQQPDERRGLVFASAWGCLETWAHFAEKVAQGGPKLAPPLLFTHSYANAPAAFLAIYFGLAGHHGCYADGWNSSLEALADAARAAAEGRCGQALACAAESLSPPRQARYAPGGPLAGRPAGEGAAAFVLEPPAARERALGLLLGTGEAGGADCAAAALAACRLALDEGETRPAEVRLLVWPGHAPLPAALAAAFPNARALALAEAGGDCEGASGLLQILPIILAEEQAGCGLAVTWNPEGPAAAALAAPAQRR